MTPTRSRHVLLALGLGVFLTLIYLLSFSGIFKTTDEQYIIDTTNAFTTRSGPDRLLLNQTVYLRGLQTTDVEPSQPVLAIPLYWIAYHIPWIGNVHMLYLFNVFVTALTGLIVFYYALSLGYSDRTSVISVLLFGLTTIVWPYSKTFFREPLTMLTLIGSAYFLQRWRVAFIHHQRRSEWLWLVLSVATIVVSILSKEAVLVAIPMLALFGIPDWGTLLRRRRELLIIGIVLVVITVLMVLGVIFFREQLLLLVSRYQLLERLISLIDGMPKAWYATLGYLFSPAKGIFWYSPILILAAGAPFLLPQRNWREAWLPLVLLVSFAIVYAAIRGPLWHGGAGWGGRYTVPMTPFLMVGSLPLLDRTIQGKKIAPKVIVGLLALAGLVIQLGAVYVSFLDYDDYQQSITHLVPWNDTIVWSVQWSQAIGTLLYLPNAQPDIIWLIPKPDLVAIGVITAGLGLTMAAVWQLYRGGVGFKGLVGVWMTVASMVAGILFFVLARAYDDPRFEGHNTDLHAMRASLIQQAGPDDIILLASPRYVAHFMNYFKATPIWYSLALSPGERYSCEDPVRVGPDAPLEETVADVGLGMYGFVYRLNVPVWLVIDNGPLVPCATRPVERLYTERAYPVKATDFTALVRLVEVLPLPLPQTDEPEHRLNAQFGDAIRLVGYDLIVDNKYNTIEDLEPGDLIGIGLIWEAEELIKDDYTVAVFLIGPDGGVVQQQDRQPLAGFYPTSTWAPGNRLRDNYGFILPDSLPSGEYQFWIVLYDWRSLERLTVAGPNGSDARDHIVLATIEIK
jgi:hypothetical protein